MGEASTSAAYIGKETDFPVLILWGKADRTCPYKGAAELKDLIPRATLVSMEKVKHMLVVEFPRQVGDAITAFINAEDIAKVFTDMPGEVSVDN